MPITMEKYGFKNIQTGFVTIDLTPDNPKFSLEFAHDMINADRYSDIDVVHSVLYTILEHFSIEEIEEMRRLIHAKYDTRIVLYDRGEKQWNTNVSIIMVIRVGK